MMKKKMLYLTPYDVSVPLSGAPARSREFVKVLSNYYDIHLVSIEGNARVPEKISPERQAKYNSYLGNVSIKQKVKFSRFAHFIYSHQLLKAARRLMNEEKYDIIFAEYANASIYGYILAKQFGVPWVYSSLNIEYRRFLDLGKIDPKRYPFVPFMYLVERLGATADIVVVISEDDAKVFKKWVCEDRLIVVLQGFNEQVFNPYYEEPRTSQPIVLFYGSLTHLPNREAAITIVNKILPKVVEKIPNVLFQFVGANPSKELIHPNTELTGFVDNLVDYIHRATVSIAPITFGAGMRTKIIEALACGKPVISTKKGAVGISRRYKNLIIKEIEEFPQAICEVINNKMPIDDSDFESLKQEFSWSRNVLRLKQKIDEVIFKHNKRMESE